MTEGAQEGIDEVPGTWKSAMGNDIVLQTIEEGEGSDKSKVAEYLSVVTFDAKGYFLKGGGGASGMMSENKVRSDAPFENTTGQRVQVGEGDTNMGLELGLKTLGRPGAVFRVRMSAKYGFGSEGRKEVESETTNGTNNIDKRSINTAMCVPPMQDLEYVVTVIDVVNIDNFLKDEPNQGRYGAYEEVLLRKEVGNRYFHCGDHHRAALSYSKGSRKGDVFYSANSRDSEAGKKMWNVYISCLNNLSACYISSGEFMKAKESCLKVLEMENTNIKALLRAARASLALLSFEESEACIARVLELEPDNMLAQAERVKLSRAKREYKGKRKVLDKQMTKNMFGGSGAGDKEHEKQAKGSSGEKEGAADAKASVETASRQRAENEKGSGEAALASMASSAPTKQPGASGYGESSNLILLLSTAAIIVFLSVWLAWN